MYIIKGQKFEGINGTGKKFSNWKILKENSSPDVNINFFLFLEIFSEL